ncbi:hybrid sensor histidine kinase/response regulator, partial [Oceanispirochaeta sp.]|uniref:ATP-binding response regulator n=1 Tax=Oceanispirochaeta sp. TaxID=2035350 RepID=UPI00261871CC
FEAGGSDYITKPFYGQELLERVKTQLELKNQRDQLEKNQLQLKELLHILSHDLRNSFSGISMIMDLAELEGKSIEVYKDRLKDLNLNGLNILDLVSTMLELEGKPLTLGSVNLNECLEHTIELMKPRFKEKNIALKLDLEENTIVLAEKTSLINSVLMNILTNALKFSFKGGEVSISIRTKNFLVTLGIEDSGIGISESQILHLFNVRKGISRPGTSGEKGSGFGLPLAWKFMQAYGGEINVISGEKKAEDHPGGTRIILSFLLAQSLEEKA